MDDLKTSTKVELEYTLNTSPLLLFNRLSTPSGLSEWFADDVNLSGNVFTFIWDNTQVKAEIIEKKDNKYIKFRWLKEDSTPNDIFMFRLVTHELTGEVALQVIEMVNPMEDPEETISLWNTQIGELKRILGI